MATAAGHGLPPPASNRIRLMKQKYFIAAFATIAAIATGNAGITQPHPSYFEDFSTMESRELVDGWTTYGRGCTPIADWQPLFGTTGEAPYYMVLEIAGVRGAFSNSSFVQDIGADEWLVTPAIHVESDNELLMLTVGAFGENRLNEYQVFLSDTGNTKEDFVNAPIIVSTLYGWDDGLNTKRSVAVIKGYEGKDIHLAFVNRSKDSGLLGVTEMKMAPYLMDVLNETPQVMPQGESFGISVATTVYTTEEVRGLKAELTTSNGLTRIMDIDKTLLPTGTPLNIVFPDEVVMDVDKIEYTVTLTPCIGDDVTPTVVTGMVTQPSTSYPPVAVVEEFTGAWCTHCPRGAAYMEYYHDTYTGGDKGRVIGIALHSQDAMEISGRAYLSLAMEASNADGYPGAFFSRTLSGDPSDVETLESVLGRTFYSSVAIERVATATDAFDNPVLTVTCNVENAYPKQNIDQRLAIVVVENDVRGDTPDYNQTNYFSKMPQVTIESTYGEELWPYFEFYAEATNPVPYTDMVYQHVARGIYPDYYGALIESECEAEVPVGIELTVPVPDNVLKRDNISVVALLIDNRTGQILYADEMDASGFVGTDIPDTPDTPDSVETLAEEGIAVACDGNTLTVRADNGADVDVYASDGSPLGRGKAAPEYRLSVEGVRGMAVVRVRTAAGICVKKIII